MKLYPGLQPALPLLGSDHRVHHEALSWVRVASRPIAHLRGTQRHLRVSQG